MEQFPFHREWLLDRIDEGHVREITRRTSLPLFISRFLVRRGFDTVTKIERHLRASLHDISDPDLLIDIDKAVHRIIQAISRKEKIGIFGDYDCDGITATSLLYDFFLQLGLKVFVYLPHREKDGYGLNRDGIDYLYRSGCSLMITVDCGISNFEEIDYARTLGLDVIVTDHHEVQDRIPNAFAVIDPKRRDCRFPFKDLAGVGVAFNLARAVRRNLTERGYKGQIRLKPYLDLVALGTLADHMPLIGDNRILVKAGIQEILNTTRPGLIQLTMVSGGSIRNIQDICFKLIPRINAASRMDSPYHAFRLLTTTDTSEAVRLSKVLDELNRRRIEEEKRILTEATNQLHDYINRFGKKKGYVLFSDTWKKGLVGVIATKLMTDLGLPIILFTVEGENSFGSGRGPDDMDLLSIIKKLEGHLVSYGGHKSAMGIHLLSENLERFREDFERLIEMHYEPSVKGLVVDFRTNFFEISDPKVVDYYEQLEPFGPSYSQPVFTIDGFKVKSQRVLNERGLKLLLSHEHGFGNEDYELLCWDLPMQPHNWEDMEIACTATVNAWNGIKKLELRLKDARVKSRK